MKTVNRMGVSLLLVLWAIGAQAAVLVVNRNLNAPTGDHVYSSLQAAIDAAAAGDTLHIIASPESYGDVNVTKQLTFYGVGAEPDKELPVTSKVGTMTLKDATVGGGDASLTHVEGVVATRFTLSNDLSDITITRCSFQYFNMTNYSDITNLLISSCTVANGGYITFYNTTDYVKANVVIRNCIFADANIQHASHNTLISNNVFFATINSSSGQALYQPDDCLVYNNIFYGTPTAYTAERCTFNNNMSYGNTNGDHLALPAAGVSNSGQLNQVNVDPQFVNFPSAGSNTYSIGYDFHIQAGSDAEGSGTDGTNLGIYGGAIPFNIDVSLPLIQQFNTAGVIKQGDDLNVTVRAKAN
jgi:hypothetical protein